MNKKRSIGQEILEAIQAIKQGHGKRKPIECFEDIVLVRHKLHLSQTEFASLMGISVRTLQDWEQGRRKPQDPNNGLVRDQSVF